MRQKKDDHFEEDANEMIFCRMVVQRTILRGIIMFRMMIIRTVVLMIIMLRVTLFVLGARGVLNIG